MSYFKGNDIIFPVKEGSHLDPPTLRKTLKQPNFIKNFLIELGYPAEEISLIQLKKLCDELKQEEVFQKLMPTLKEVEDEKGMINVKNLENFLANSADLDLEKSMPPNEKLESIFNYISKGKPYMTAKEMYTELMAKGILY